MGRESKLVKIATVIAFIAVTTWLGTIIFVAQHFIRKYW